MELKKEQTNKLIPIFMIAILLIFFIGNYIGQRSFKEEGLIVQEGNVTYRKFLDNYYNVDYENNKDGLTLKINNPCIEIVEGNGISMKPYWDDKQLTIIDTCYPVEDLKIGDVVIYYGELDSTTNPHHRIVDIDYEKRWIQTQGDNPKTNPTPDDFVSFDRIYGKDIGVLNVLEDKKVVKEEVVNESEFLIEGDFGNITFFTKNQTCVCSSTRFLQFCSQNETQLLTDTFILENDLKEKYC